MTEVIKRACLIYVSATSGMVPAARERLEAEGYGVCEVLAELDTAIAAAGHDLSALPTALKECIVSADLCVFLLPQDATIDGCIPAGGSLSSELGKPFIGVVDGGRDVLPAPFEQDAAGIVHDCDEGLAQAIRGDRSFRNPDGSVRERNIRHLKCQ